MRFSFNWLQEFLPEEINLDKTIESLEQLGFSVAGTKHHKPTFDGIVVANVLDVWKHPQADKLRLAQVAHGSQNAKVVCGAPNLAKGQKVAFAPIGAHLQIPKKGPMRIQKALLRGEESDGMICSSFELGLNDNHEGILVLPESWTNGSGLESYLKSDTIIDAEIPSHRWDLMSHLGLARELCLYLFRKEPKAQKIADLALIKKENQPPVGIHADAQNACQRYMGAVIDNVQIRPSAPDLAWRLKALGINAINNIVDVTNFVTLEIGQPTHAFDLSKLKGPEIKIRWAKNKENFLGLDGKNYELSERDLVIADSQSPVALAGVIGGETSKVAETTRSLFLECAWFTRGPVRQTARRHGIQTESSCRFEKETDKKRLDWAIARALQLILENAPQASPRNWFDSHPLADKPRRVEIQVSDIKSCLGLAPEEEDFESLLIPMSESCVKLGAGRWQVEPKSWRADLALPEDFAEEVLRLKGLKDQAPSADSSPRIPEKTNVPANTVNLQNRESLAGQFLERFQGLGFQEVINFPLISAKTVRHLFNEETLITSPVISNPVSSELELYRVSLLPGLLQNWKLNFNRGKRFIRLQEIGYATNNVLCWAALSSSRKNAHPHWLDNKPQSATFWDLLGALEAFVSQLGLEYSKSPCQCQNSSFHPSLALDFFSTGQRVGHIAEIAIKDTWEAKIAQAPVIFAEFDLNNLSRQSTAKTLKYKPSSALPQVERDLAIVVDQKITWEEIKTTVANAAQDALTALYPFDVYTSEDLGARKKSVAFRLTLTPREKSFTHSEIQAIMDKAADALATQLKAKPRQ